MIWKYEVKVFFCYIQGVNWPMFEIWSLDNDKHKITHLASTIFVRAHDLAKKFSLSSPPWKSMQNFCLSPANDDPLLPWQERVFLTISNHVFTIIFAIEMGLKVMAQGFIFNTKAYMRSGWNVMDGILVFVSILDFLISVVFGSNRRIFGILRVFRLLRTLRPLRYDFSLRAHRPTRILKAVSENPNNGPEGFERSAFFARQNQRLFPRHELAVLRRFQAADSGRKAIKTRRCLKLLKISKKNALTKYLKCFRN